MLSVNFILGKSEREPIKQIKTDIPPYRYSRIEMGEGSTIFPIRKEGQFSYFPIRKEGQFSYKTDRDFEQVVGNLYKSNQVEGPTLVKRK